MSHHKTTEQNPIFSEVFGSDWENLPPVMQKHYANRPYSDDRTTVKGEMNVSFNRFFTLLAPLSRATASLVPKAGKNIPTIVHFDSETDTFAFCFNRIFHFADDDIFHFNTRMLHLGGNEMLDITSLGLSWHCSYSWQDNHVKMKHIGYKWRILGLNIPIPLTLLIGACEAEEHCLSDDIFAMKMTITHPLWGETYSYSGTFTVTEENQTYD